MLDITDLRYQVISPTLRFIDRHSLSVEILILIVGIIESGLQNLR